MKRVVIEIGRWFPFAASLLLFGGAVAQNILTPFQGVATIAAVGFITWNTR